jgi:fructose-specific phosphotransferase system IIC component
MQVEIIVPLIVFASITLIIATPFYFKHRNRRLVFEAIKTHVEKTGTADPQLIDAITQENIGPNADLRRGILLIAFAAGLIMWSRYLDDGDMAAAMFGFAFVPGLIGLAFVIFHFFIRREATV